MGENRTVKSALEEIAEAMSSSVNKTVSKTAEEIKKQRESNPGAKYARNMVAANLIGLQSGKKQEDGSWSFENPEDLLRFQVAMRSADAARDEFHTALRARVDGKVDLLKTIYGKYNSLQDGAMISEEEQLQYRSQAKRIADSLQATRKDLEKNKGMYSREEYDKLNSYLQEMEGYALEIGKTPVAQSAYPWIPVGAVDTDGDGKRDNFVTGGQLVWDQTRRNDENVGKALDTYNKTHDYAFRAKSKEEQNREIEGQIKEIEAIYTPQAEQQDEGVWLRTGPETGVTAPLKWNMKPVSRNEAWNLWDGLQQMLDYVLYSDTYTEEEAQRIANRVYGVKNTYDDLASEELKDAVEWRYGETAEDFMKEFAYQKGIYTREKIPYMSFDRLMKAAFQGDEMGKIASGYLANARLTEGEYNRFISGAETAYKQGKITEKEAKELIGQRTANGTEANVEGINNALTYRESHGTLEMSGKGFELGSKMGVEQIFEASQGSVDEMVKRASGYINEAVGGILDMMGFDVGKELADKGVEQQSYRNQKLKDSKQVQYNWMREYNNELEGVDSRIGRWFADKVPGMTASLMNMAFSSAVGGSIANGASAFNTAFGGVKTGKGITDLNLSMGYRMVNYGIKNAGNFVMSTGAVLNTYASVSEDERMSFGRKMAYAMADGAIEFFSEIQFGGNPLLDGAEAGLFTKLVYEITDNGTFDSITKTWLECLKSGSWKALVQKFVSSGAFDMAGEGLEEVLSSTAMMAVDYALYGKTDVTWESLGNDFATGLMLSMFLTGGKNMINVFSPIDENGEYKKIKYFTAEQQVDRDSMDAQLMLYAVEYLAGDTELMQKNGLTEKEAKKAKKEFARILGEYAQATSWMDAGEGGKLNAESLVKAAKGVYGKVDASLFTPETAAEDATNVVKAWNEVLDESWSPANLVPVVSNMAKLAQAAYINLENAVTMGEVDMDSAYEIMLEVGTVRDDAMEALDAYVELRKSGKRIETAEEAAAEAVEETAAAASEEGGEAGANAEAGRLVEQEETAAEIEANNEVSQPVEQEQQRANAGKEETRTAAEGEKSGSETAITQNQPAVEEGGSNNGRTEVSDEGGKRNDGMGAGEQGGGVDEGAGRPAAGRRSSRSAAVEVRRAVQAGESEKITPNALGVKGGSKKETIDILSREAVDRIDSLRAIREEAEKDGATVEFFTGKMKVYNKTKKNFSSIEGVRLENEDGSTRYLIKADSTIRSPEMIYRHEKFHDMVNKNQDMLVELRDRLLSIYKPEKVRSLIQAYIEAYHGIYGEYTENMTEDEILAMESAYMEEILADVYADIRRGSANLGAGRAVLKSQIEDMERSSRQNRAAVERKNGPGEQYSFENVPTENEIEENIEIVSTMDSVYDVIGTEFAKGPVDLITQVTEFFDSIGNKAWNEMLGEVVLERGGVKNDIGHGMGRKKAASYIAVPTVISEGKVIDYQINWKGRGYNTAVIAAPIKIAGEPYIMGVIVEEKEENKFYVHEVIAERESMPFKTEARKGDLSGNNALSILKILQKVRDVKQKYSVEDEVEELDEGYRRATQEETKYLKAPEQDLTIDGLNPVDVTDDMIMSDEDVRKAARQEAREAEETAMRLAKEEGNASEARIRLKAMQAGSSALSAKLKQTQLRISHMKFAERNGQMTEGMRGMLWRAERTYEIQKEELASRRKEEKKLREKVRIEEAENQKPVEAKKKMKQDLLEIYSIPAGQRDEARKLIDKFADKIIAKGSIDNQDKNELLDILFSKGMVRIGPDDYYAEVRSYLMGGRIYVPAELREEFGDDWNSFRKEAFGANVLLTNNPLDMAADVWLKDLANMFPGGFAEDMDLREGLEQIVKLANEGKAENLTLAEMIRRNQDEYGWSAEEQMEELERRAEQLIRDFCNTAKLEMKIKRESAYKEIALRNKYREMIEREAKQRHDNQTRATVMEQIKRLKKMRNRTAPEIKAMIDEVLKGIDTVARSISEYGLEDLQEFEKKYWESKKDENFIPNEYLEARIARLHLKQIDDMDLDEVVELGKTILGIVHSVQTRNKLLAEERNQKISEAGKAVMKEVNATEGSDGGAMFQWLVKNQLSPVRMFKMLGGWLENGELTNLAYELERGQTKQLEYLRGAIRLFDDVVKDEKMQEWFRTASGKDARWIELSVDGKTVHITPMMRVSLYLHSLNYDNMRHISGGGIKVPDMELYKKGRITDAYAKGTRVKIDIKTMKSITAGMSSEELRFAQAMRKYFNEYSTEKINETSMILDGFERAGGKNYYHIKVDKNFLEKDANEFVRRDIAASSIASIVNERVQSTLQIILEDANVALEDHMNNISRYYGLAIPIRDLNAVMQYTQFSNKGEAENSVPDTIGSKWGEGATKYIQKLIADLQGGTQEDGMISRTLAKLRGKLAGANLAGNPSVVSSQFASYPAAMPVLGPKALIHGLNLRKKVDMDLVEKYSPLLWYRNQGNSTQELGDYMHDKTIDQKLPKLMNLIQWADVKTVRRLWVAAEYKVQDETDLRPGSKEEIDAGTDEYYRRVAELFNRAVYDTQPNYTVMQRPEALRTKNELEKIFTAFKTVSMQTYNMMFEAAGTYKAAKKRGDAAEIKTARTYLARTAAGIMTANVLYNAIKTFFRLARGNDDRYRNEDGEFTFWSVAGGFGLDLVEIFAGCIIGGSEIVSGLEYVVDKLIGDGKTTFKTPEMSALEWGYDTVVAGVEALNNLFDGDWRDFAGGVKQTAKQIAMAFGIPANNVESYLLTVAKWVYPEAAMEYDNLFGEITKNSLAYQGNRTVNAAISVIMENRTDDLEDDAVEEIQRLWGKGFRSAVPSPVPASVTIDNENVQLTAKQKSAYKDAWNREVSDNLKWLMESAEYTEADDELRQKMIGKLYAYADAVAKSEMGIGYEAEKWVEIAKTDVPDYIAYAVVRNSIDRDKTLEENAKAIQAVIAHDAGGISEEDAQEIARLYVDKHDGMIPGEVPEIITYKDEDGNEVEIRLTSEQREIYSTSFRDCVGDQLSAMMASKEYTDADDDTRSAMIKSLWTFARQTAKEAVDENVAPEKWVADGLNLMENGVELSTYITYTKKAKELDGKDENGETTNGLLNSRRIDLINQQDWTSTQKEEAYRDTIDNEEKLNALKKAGLSWEQASKVLRVTGDEWNKVKTIASMGLTNNKAAQAAMVYLSDGAKEKVRVGASLGVKLSDYVEVMDNADKNKNGSVNQEEAKDYIRTMGLSPQQSAYLWQMVCSTKSAKNNPFSSTFGWEFLDRMPE